jgi:hypothetical protein
MTKEERFHLAKSYEAAWYAVKGSSMTITIKPSGWYTKAHRGYHVGNVRASELLRGLFTLTTQLAVKKQETTDSVGSFQNHLTVTGNLAQ